MTQALAVVQESVDRPAPRRFAKLQIFPVRHHSPRASLILPEVIAKLRPAHILIEGPADASGLIPTLVDAGTVPPIALLYFLRGAAVSTVPFAEFSPEYQAMKIATRLGIPVSFCDLPYCMRPARDEPVLAAVPAEAESAEEVLPEPIRRGFLDVLWETEIELNEMDAATYLEAASIVGHESRSPSKYDRTREAYMYTRIARLVDAGIDPRRILVVCGAAHAPALADADVDLSLLDGLTSVADPEIYVVPYSFSRFSSVLGYGAGTSYPHFYQTVWEAGGRVEDAVCRILTETCHDLGADGHEGSLADAIDAMSFARQLASLRNKGAPGPEEIVQAVESCLTRGHFERAADAVRKRLVGEKLGRIAKGAEQSPLAREFYGYLADERRAPHLPLSDLSAKRSFDLTHPLEQEISRFLHRLALIGVPYALPEDELTRYLMQVAANAASADRKATPVPLPQMARGVRRGRERWTLQWCSTLDMELADASGIAATLEEAARTRAERMLGESKRLPEAVALAIEVDRANLERMVLPCVARVEELLRHSRDLREIVVAAQELTRAADYGGGLAAPDRARALAAAMTRRAVWLLARHPRVSEEDLPAAVETLDRLADMRRSLDRPTMQAVDAGLRDAARSHELQPQLAGAACAVAFRAQIIGPLTLVEELFERITRSEELSDGADYLEAVIANAREAMISSADVMEVLRELVLRLPEREFLTVLPVLRRGFACATSSEVSYFMAQLCAPPSARVIAAGTRVTRRLNAAADRRCAAGAVRWRVRA